MAPDAQAISKIPFRILFYLLVIPYLLLDFGLHGPAWKRLQAFRGAAGPDAEAFAVQHGWAATVNGKPITKAQLDLAVDLFLARRGKTWESLPPADLKITRLAVLNDLISDELIAQWSVAQPEPVPQPWIEHGIATFESGFAPGRLQALSVAQDLGEARFRSLLYAHLYQVHWLDRKVAKSVEVTSAESREWYDRHAALLEAPEAVRARHLFLSTVETDTPERDQLVRDLHARIERGDARLEDLTAEFSEDERTRHVGGDLGWFSRNRMPEDFTTPVFALKPGTCSTPFRTSIGWHVVVVEEKIPARKLDWEEVKPEIALYLANEWKLAALDELLHEQLRIARRANVVMFPPALDFPRR